MKKYNYPLNALKQLMNYNPAKATGIAMAASKMVYDFRGFTEEKILDAF